MSLSAQIEIAPPRRLVACATTAAIGGVVVASSAVAARWPDRLPIIAILALLSICAVVAILRRDAKRAIRRRLIVSDRAEIDVFPDLESGDEESWRLTGSTMIWAGFSVLALRKDNDGAYEGRSMLLPVLDPQLNDADRRALSRFLLWSLRTGGGRIRRSGSGASHP